MRVQKHSILLISFILILITIISVQKTFQKDVSIQILHFNDLHSRFIPSSSIDGNDCTEQADCVGGVARLKTLIDSLKQSHPNTLVLSAGDNYQGSLFFSIFKEQSLIEVLNMISIDIMGLGNHEFDEGNESLANFITQAEFPVLGGNTIIASTSPLFGKMPEYTIVEFNGTKVGIISAVTANTPTLSSPGSEVSFKDEQIYLKEISEALTEKGIRIIIAITHQGYNADITTAQAIPLIDIIVGGHSDTLLSNIQESAEGPYPTRITHSNGGSTLIVQTKPYGTQLGQLIANFNQEGEVTTYSGEPVIVNDDIEPNEQLSTYIDSLNEQLEPIRKTIVGTVSEIIVGRPEVCRSDDCPLGNLVTDSLLLLDSEEKITPSIALINSGSLRSSLPSGTITKNDLITAIPFNNSISYITLSGGELRTLLEKSVADAQEHSGGFLQISGITVHYDPSKETGNKICSIIEKASNEAIDPLKTYTVATITYISNGGDGYEIGSEQKNSSSTVYHALEEYLANNQYYQSSQDDRINTHCD